MKTPYSNNINKILTINNALKEISQKIVYVGGIATELLFTHPYIPAVRSTMDIDVIVEAATRLEYIKLEDRLRQLKFSPKIGENEPICRYEYQNLILDFMPTSSEILGFTNRWYQDALEHHDIYKISDQKINLITGPYFIATKLEAFKGRGNGDFLYSHDIEDIVTILDRRETIVEEIQNSKSSVKEYLITSFSDLYKNESFMGSIAAHLLADTTSQNRISIIISNIQNIIRL